MYIIEQVEMDSDGNYSMQNFQNRIPLGKPKKITFLEDMSVKGGGAKQLSGKKMKIFAGKK